MESLGKLGSKTALDVVVDAQIAFHHVAEVSDDFVGVLVKESLQLGHLFVVVEVLFILGVQLNEDGVVVLQSLNQLLLTLLVGQVRRSGQLVVLLLQTLVELGQLHLHVFLDVALLVAHNLENAVFELGFALEKQLLQLDEHGVHEGSQDAQMFFRHALPLFDIFLNVPEVFAEVVDSLQRTLNLLLFSLKLIESPVTDSKHPSCVKGSDLFLGCSGCLLLLRQGFLLLKFIVDTLLAQGAFLEKHNWFGEVFLTQVHLDGSKHERRGYSGRLGCLARHSIGHSRQPCLCLVIFLRLTL